MILIKNSLLEKVNCTNFINVKFIINIIINQFLNMFKILKRKIQNYHQNDIIKIIIQMKINKIYQK